MKLFKNNLLKIILVCVLEILTTISLTASFLIFGYMIQAALNVGQPILILYSVIVPATLFNINLYLFFLYLLIGLTLLVIFLKLFNSYYQQYVIASLRYEFRLGITKYIRNNNYSKNCQDQETWLSWYKNDTDIVSDRFYKEIFSACATISNIFFSLIFLGLLNWILTLVALIFVVISVLLPIIFLKYTNKKIEAISESNEQWVKECTKLLNMYDTCLFWQKFTVLNQMLIHECKKLKDKSISIYYDLFKVLILGVVFITTFSMGMILVASILITIYIPNSGINLIASSNSIALNLFTGLNLLGQALGNMSGGIKVSKKFINSKDQKNNVNTFSKLKVAVSEISYENKTIQRDINFELSKNMKMIITGNSGSGKSSLLKIITGENLNYKGDILLDANNYKNINLNSLAKFVWMINTQSYLFKNTRLKENIILFDKSYNENKLNEALKKAELLELANQLDQEVDFESKNPYSEGQMQKIALARFFYHQKDNDLLILDEGFSNLDVLNREKLENNLLSDANLSLIYVTHHLNEKNLNKFNLNINFSAGDK